MKIGILFCAMVFFVSAEVRTYGFQVVLNRDVGVGFAVGFDALNREMAVVSAAGLNASIRDMGVCSLSTASPGFDASNREMAVVSVAGLKASIRDVGVGSLSDALPGFDASKQDTSVVSDDRPERIDEIRLRIEQLRRNMPTGVQVVSGNQDAAEPSELAREEEVLRMMSRLEELITQLELHQSTITQTQTVGSGLVRGDTIRVFVRDTVVVRDTVFVERETATPPEIRTIEVELLGTGIFRTSSVLFEFDRTRILSASFPILDEIGRILSERGDVRIEVQGHTDSFGTREYNLNLSEMRAEAVRQYLLEKNPAIAADRIVARGLGPDEPIAENTSTTGRALNRRVDFVVLE